MHVRIEAMQDSRVGPWVEYAGVCFRLAIGSVV